ncbi:MAG TPA: hypothetical protein VEV45_09400 [Streptosporangiaceae bacterium]|nr:hypothetical protein [Streptosporangiaceae bacterium]
MSGAGDTGGEVSRDEAAWRDLIARFDLPADPELTSSPWPAREDLAGAAETSPDLPGPGRITGAAEPDRSGSAGRPDNDGGAADPVADSVITPDQFGGHQARPPAASPWTRPSGGYIPVDRTRVIRQAGDPRSYSPPEEDDERYVPVPLPPPARLDSYSKAALVGVIGGPGYLLLSVLLHWAISATAAFVAVAAFIGGFVTLVVKLGDRPHRDDDDDGAVL